MKIHFDRDLVERYGGRGPRYTSYPTALQFTEPFPLATYEEFAAASNATGKPLSLYVHIPFCHTLCYYCACNKIVTRNADRVARYMQALQQEIDLQAALIADQRCVEQLHFGGGTPTYLSLDELAGLVDLLDRKFHFAATGQREFSIEVDPRSVDSDGVRQLAAMGFNRLSLGIQDFDPKVQDAVNRRQSATQVQQLVDAARGAGFRSVSFDLIYGLPLQSVASFEKTLDSVIAIRPDRLAVYNYAHLPQRFKGQRMIRGADIPRPETKLDILQCTVDRLCGAGWEYVGMDHFALPEDDLVKARRDGSLQRNFQGYSTHRQCDLVSLGVSAISHIGRMFAQNTLTTAGYEARLTAGELPIQKGLVVDTDDAIRAAAIEALMCYDVLEFADIERRFGIEFVDYFGAELSRMKDLESDGLVDIGANRIAITQTGRLLLRSIAMMFDRYIDHAQNDGRFSKAI